MTTTSNELVVNAVSQEGEKIPLNLEDIQELANSVSYGDLHTLIKTLLTDRDVISARNFHVMLNIAQDPKQHLYDYLSTVELTLPNTPEAEQLIKSGEINMPRTIDEMNELGKIVTIDVEKQYGYPAIFFNQLCEPLRERYVRMHGKSPNPNKPFEPLTKGLIYNTPINVLRTIYYMANEDNILKFNTNKENEYPFVVLKKELRELLANIFLKIATSEYFGILAPLYVFSLIPFCASESMGLFNVSYPLNKINRPELSSNTFREKAKDLKKIAIEYARCRHQDIQPVEESTSDDTIKQSSK